jgi:hypothetical protein
VAVPGEELGLPLGQAARAQAQAPEPEPEPEQRRALRAPSALLVLVLVLVLVPEPGRLETMLRGGFVPRHLAPPNKCPTRPGLRARGDYPDKP